MSHIHVIGASGYIGSLLVNQLIAHGHLVEISHNRLPNIPINSIDTDILIHLAFSGGGTEHFRRVGEGNLKQMQEVNIKGMKALLSGLKNRMTKIIFLSSTAVYGKFHDIPLLNEDAELFPLSNYGRHKVQSEDILRDSAFEWLILRPSGVFGPSVDNRFGNSFLNVVVSNAIKKGEINILGGEQKIDTLFIWDLIQIILRSCTAEWYPRETFNVAGEIVSVREMLNIIAKSIIELGLPCSISTTDFAGKPSMLTDTRKLRQAFPAWKNTDLNTSLASLVSVHLDLYHNKKKFN